MSPLYLWVALKLCNVIHLRSSPDVCVVVWDRLQRVQDTAVCNSSWTPRVFAIHYNSNTIQLLKQRPRELVHGGILIPAQNKAKHAFKMKAPMHFKTKAAARQRNMCTALWLVQNKSTGFKSTCTSNILRGWPYLPRQMSLVSSPREQDMMIVHTEATGILVRETMMTVT